LRNHVEILLGGEYDAYMQQVHTK